MITDARKDRFTSKEGDFEITYPEKKKSSKKASGTKQTAKTPADRKKDKV